MQSTENVSLNNQKYFDDFFRRNYQVLCYFAYSFLKDRDIAEDVVQNIFMKILHDSTVYSTEEHLKYYLFKSIRNECINELKKNTLRSEILEKITACLHEETDDSDIYSSIVRAEIYREIIVAINSLPEKCGEIFNLAYIEHLDNNEIAEKLNISINTVKVQKNNAKKQLRQYLKHLYPIAALLFHLQ